MNIKTLLFSAACILTMTACFSDDGYDTGNGDYSNLIGDFVEAHSDANCQLDYIFTDDNERYLTTQLYSVPFMKTPDSLYRALALFEKKENNKVSVYQMSLIPTLIADTLAEGKEMKTDPVELTSVWMSKSFKYLNIQMGLKVGSTNSSETSKQVVGMVDRGIQTLADGTTITNIELYHDQKGMPDYYTQNYYVSVPCLKFYTDSIRLTVNTYNGKQTITMSLD